MPVVMGKKAETNSETEKKWAVLTLESPRTSL